MNSRVKRLIKTALAWVEAKDRHAKKPSSKRLNVEFLAQLALLSAIREIRRD